jgi:hypothetical protein
MTLEVVSGSVPGQDDRRLLGGPDLVEEAADRFVGLDATGSAAQVEAANAVVAAATRTVRTTILRARCGWVPRSHLSV